MISVGIQTKGTASSRSSSGAVLMTMQNLDQYEEVKPKSAELRFTRIRKPNLNLKPSVSIKCKGPLDE